MSPVSHEDVTVQISLDELRAAARRLGPYELRRELGRGGMGVVYQAYHHALRRECAVKLLQSTRNEVVAERFVLEGQAAARLGKHPNIVGVFDAGVIDGTAYIAMEYVEGEPLDAILARRGRLPEAEVLAIGEQVARALAHAHRHGIVHRDMKPGNIMIDRDGTPQILDFGLAKDLGVTDSAMSVAGHIMGTPNYMPPEQADHRRGSVDARTDVYSLGATLYHAASGRMPFSAERVVDVIVQVLTRDPPRLRGTGVSADGEAVIARAMEKEKRHRYQSATELADDLARVLHGDAPKARPVGPVGRLWRRIRRRPGIAVLVALFVLFAAAGTGYVLYRQDEAEALWSSAYTQVARATAAETRDLLEPALPLIRECEQLATYHLLDVDDTDALALNLVGRILYRDRLSWLSYGDATGRFTGAQRRPDGSIVVNRSWVDDDGAGGHVKEELVLEHGERELLREDPSDYDPRTRPWYGVAASHDEPTWLPPYEWAGNEGFGITVTLRHDVGGVMRGAFTADFRLEALSRFLAGLDLPERSRAYLMTRKGEVVARSDSGKNDAPHEVLDAALAAGVDLGGLARGAVSSVVVDFAGEPWVASFEAFSLRGGLDWVSAAVIPVATIRGDVGKLAFVLIIAGAVFFVVIVGLAVVGALVRRRRLRAARR
ncbi:MAG: protein kinase [Myxococcales bacterium]|nr:protein kinase [Myxococcales bacterium]